MTDIDPTPPNPPNPLDTLPNTEPEPILIQANLDDPNARFLTDEELDEQFSNIYDSVYTTDPQPEPSPAEPADPEPESDPESEPATDPEPDPEPSVTPDPEQTPSPTPPSPPTSPPPSPPYTTDPQGRLVINGVVIPPNDAAAVASLYTRINTDPIFASKIADLARANPYGIPAPVPTPTNEPSVAPEEIDLSDPTTKALWTELQALKVNQSQIATSIQQPIHQLREQTALRDIETGIQSFRSTHSDLTDNDINTLRTKAASMKILPGLMESMDNSPAAIARSMEIAYYDTPELQKKVEAKTTQTRKDTARTRKLSALSSSSTPAPRTTTPVRHLDDRSNITEMANEIAGAMAQGAAN